MTADATIIVPADSGTLKTLPYFYEGLSRQTNKNFELILVFKPTTESTITQIQNSLNTLSFKSKLVIQRAGGFTRALNMGKECVSGDIVLFTDADAIPCQEWIQNYVILYEKLSEIGSISSRDIYINEPTKRRLYDFFDRGLSGRVIRELGRFTFRSPHERFSPYSNGVYIDRNFRVQIGPYILFKDCCSLPYKGVNMSFRKQALRGVSFLEHPLLKRYPWNEQYLGIQIVKNGWASIFVSSNPVYHIWRGDLTRVYNKNASRKHEFEQATMRLMIKRFIETNHLETN